jgi:hypothetical protein
LDIWWRKERFEVGRGLQCGKDIGYGDKAKKIAILGSLPVDHNRLREQEFGNGFSPLLFTKALFENYGKVEIKLFQLIRTIL